MHQVGSPIARGPHVCLPGFGAIKVSSPVPRAFPSVHLIALKGWSWPRLGRRSCAGALAATPCVRSTGTAILSAHWTIAEVKWALGSLMQEKRLFPGNAGDAGSSGGVRIDCSGSCLLDSPRSFKLYGQERGYYRYEVLGRCEAHLWAPGVRHTWEAEEGESHV